MSAQSRTRVSLTDVSLRLGIDPFDLIRVLVSLDALPDDLHFAEDEIDDVKELAGLETWWTPAAAGQRMRHEDSIPARGMARGMCRQLLDHQVLGRSATRWDNLMRGLEPDAQLLARNVLHTLLQEGYLQIFNTASGLNISVVATRAEDLRRIAEGDFYPRAMRALWEG
ncbi:MAG: hypothetical protein H6741_17410 [Alphaproteobacteria bacterium]|nr:hypothetical protein [Alphaproteobacteria bacterium]MCB9794496.1 hypothetical protein [Alphaproteobacteria bacterium]